MTELVDEDDDQVGGDQDQEDDPEVPVLQAVRVPLQHIDERRHPARA